MNALKPKIAAQYHKNRERILRWHGNTLKLLKKANLYIRFKFWTYFTFYKFRSASYLDTLRSLLLALRPPLPVFAAVLIGWIYVTYSDVSQWSIASLGDYLTASGAMIGGVLAIVFSLTIFGQQSILDVHSTNILRPYVYGWREKSIFLTITLITLLLLISGQYTTNIQADVTFYYGLAVYLSLIAIGVVFTLVDLMYELVSGKASSANIFTYLMNNALGLIKKLDRESLSVSKGILAEAKYKEQRLTNAEAVSMARQLLHKKYGPAMDHIMKVIYEIALRLLSRSEYEPANNGLRAIQRILQEYLRVVTNTSISVPADSSSLGALGILARKSDSSEFLQPNLERIAKIGEEAIKTGNTQNILLITTVFKALANQAKTIKHHGTHRDNYILNLVVGYQTQYLEVAITSGNVEAVYQVAQALKDFVQYAVEADSYLVQGQLHDNINKIVVYAVKENRSFIINECFNALNTNIFALISRQSGHKDVLFRNIFRQISSLTEFIFNAQKSGLYRDVFTVTHFFTEFMIKFPMALNVYGTIQDEETKADFRSDLLQILEELRSSIRTLSENIKDVDNALVEVIGRTLLAMNQYMIWALNHPDFVGEKTEIEKLLGWYIHQPPWFFSSAEKFEISNRNRSLTESTAQTGILLFRDYYDERLLEACVDSLFYIVRTTFEKNTEKYLYDEPRLMMRICYLGVLARKHKKTRLYAHIRVKLLEFQSLYQQAYSKQLKELPEDLDPERDRIIGFPEKNRLVKEMYQWRDELQKEQWSQYPTLSDDAQALMVEMVSIEDIDWFMFDVFGQFVSDSPISQSVDLLIARSKLVNVLKKLILKGRTFE